MFLLCKIEIIIATRKNDFNPIQRVTFISEIQNGKAPTIYQPMLFRLFFENYLKYLSSKPFRALPCLASSRAIS